MQSEGDTERRGDGRFLVRPCNDEWIIICMTTGWISKNYAVKRDAIRDAAYLEAGEMEKDDPTG